MTLTLDMYTTAALGLAMNYLGMVLRRKIVFLEKFCIPAPVVGGLLFAIVNLGLYQTGILVISFNETLKDFFMMVFFTTVGFQADLQSMKKGGKSLTVFLVLTGGLIILQNISAVSLSKLMGLSPLFGMCVGSIPMAGGHGTSAAFGPVIESMGFDGATSYTTAAATFGLIFGSLAGGPLARSLITRNSLVIEAGRVHPGEERLQREKSSFSNLSGACFIIIISLGVGTVLSHLVSRANINFPAYLGPMLVAATIRNVTEKTGKKRVPMPEIEEISGISLTIFLGIAMITLKLWQLAALALPLIIMLAVQLTLLILYSRFLVFRCMGGDYDAAVIVAGLCGFGLGATPNALANMQSVCGQYGYSEKAFLIVPLTGALFVDFINSGIITVFLNLLT